MKRIIRILAAVLPGLTIAGLAGLAGLAGAQGATAPPAPAAPRAQAQKAPPDYSAFPCLSYTLPCGKVATRSPVRKTLDGPLNGNPEKGKQIAQARNRGNCLACHVIPGGSQPGTRGTDLSHFGSAGKSDAEAYAMVYDMRTVNPATLMPPFGTNDILNEQELRDVVAYLLTFR